MAPRFTIMRRSMSLLPLLTLTSLAFTPPGMVASVPSEACSSDGAPSYIPWEPEPEQTKTFSIGGRDINVYIPSMYSQTSPGPLVFAYHDRDQSVEQLREIMRLHNPVYNSKSIVVMPKAVDGKWNSDIRPVKANKDPVKTDRDDIDFTLSLVEDLQRVLCIDLSRMHVAGFGTGGGMTHLLACDSDASTRFASFTSVGGGYGRDDNAAGNGTWANCTPGRKPVPILEMHGTEDRIMPYYLNNWEDTKKRLSVPTWLEKWSELNGCGDETLEEINSPTEKRTTYTRLEGGGVVSKGDQYGTNTIRIAKSCPVAEDSKGQPIKKPKELPLKNLPDEQISLLHYKLPSLGHVWPRSQFKRIPDLQTEEELAEQFKVEIDEKTGETYTLTQQLMFDATHVMLAWHERHPLPAHYANKNKKADEEIVKQREAMQKAMQQSSNVKEKENEKLLEHIAKSVKEGKMTEEQADIYRKKIGAASQKKESEFAGYGNDDDEEDNMEIVLDEKEIEEKLDALGRHAEGVPVDEYEEVDDDEEEEVHDEL